MTMSARNLHDSHVRRSINPLRNCYDLAADFREIDSPFAPVIDYILESTNSSDYLVVNLEMLLDAAKADQSAHQPPDPRPRGQNVAYQPCDVEEYCNEFDAGCL